MAKSSTTETKSPDQYDAAALAVATAAGAITVAVAPGPYDWFSAIIGLTLLAVVWAYEYNRSRTFWLQSAALSMSSGFISLLILGLVFELGYSGIKLAGLCPLGDVPYKPTCPKDAKSAVPWHMLVGAWVATSGLFYFIDAWLQLKIRRETARREGGS